MKSTCIALIGLVIFAFTGKDPLTGTWQRVGPGNRQVIFREDSTFDMLVNETLRLSGKYSLKENIFTIDDYGCPDMTGTYKLSFFGNNDSCRFEVIHDACDGRRAQADGAVLFRVK